MGRSGSSKVGNGNGSVSGEGTHGRRPVGSQRCSKLDMLAGHVSHCPSNPVGIAGGQWSADWRERGREKSGRRAVPLRAAILGLCGPGPCGENVHGTARGAIGECVSVGCGSITCTVCWRSPTPERDGAWREHGLGRRVSVPQYPMRQVLGACLHLWASPSALGTAMVYIHFRLWYYGIRRDLTHLSIRVTAVDELGYMKATMTAETVN
ncbi:hypothetical protein DAEQUDRAFT_278689 [Daedalea quercina L-15889]|uniref:Uncharacterized protein n=1 Tax=Daedalea quercina L-15889 TaxID=1314783 RepID=A0A165Q8B5_9APHY|nr:hypothetical protein DAEQUDRAFT_278689 [Daedalea quercina L-15889]